MCTLGMAEELKGEGIAVNSLWPKSTIATAAIAVHFPERFYRLAENRRLWLMPLISSSLKIVAKPLEIFISMKRFCGRQHR